MILIGENIHIISQKTKAAILEKDETYIKSLAKKQSAAGMDYIDLNIGPARKQHGIMKWLVETVLEVCKTGISLDTTNYEEMESGLITINGTLPTIINSTSGDPDRLEPMMSLAAKYNSNIIGLTMDNLSGIPQDSDGRLEIAMRILEKAEEKGIDNEKVFLDPLVLPVNVAQDKALESLHSIRVFKEAFDPPVKTLIGLSNISNGSPNSIRGCLNRVFLVLAMGCGLDSAIVDAFDTELIHYVNVIQTNKVCKPQDKLILDLYNLMKDFGDINDINYDKDDSEQVNIYKTAQIIMNSNIYAHNYLNI